MSDLITAYRVPLHDEHPTEEMIEWLHSSPLSWDGDESGIAIYNLGPHSDTAVSATEIIAAPGDWIVHVHYCNQWIVLPAASWPDLRRLTTIMSEV